MLKKLSFVLFLLSAPLLFAQYWNTRNNLNFIGFSNYATGGGFITGAKSKSPVLGNFAVRVMSADIYADPEDIDQFNLELEKLGLSGPANLSDKTLYPLTNFEKIEFQETNSIHTELRNICEKSYNSGWFPDMYSSIDLFYFVTDKGNYLVAVQRNENAGYELLESDFSQERIDCILYVPKSSTRTE